MKKSDLKEGDVFNAYWKEREWNDQKDHCFEGLFVVMIGDDGEKWFVDCYWGVNRWDNQKWKFTDAIKTFKLDYYTNLNEIEKVERYQLDDYLDEDLFRLHDQHSCAESCVYWFKRKGAERNVDKKVQRLNESIQKEKSNIDCSIRRIESMTSEIEKLKINGF